MYAAELGIVLLDDESRITSVCSHVAEWTGKSPASAFGTDFPFMFRPADRDRVERRIESLRKTGAVLPLAGRLLESDDHEHLVEVRPMRLECEPGSSPAYAAVLNRLYPNPNDVQLTGFTIPVPVFPVCIAVLDEERIIRCVSSNWEVVAGTAVDVALGRPFDELFPDVRRSEAQIDTVSRSVGTEHRLPQQLHLSLVPARGEDDTEVQVAAIQDLAAIDDVLDRLRYQVAIINQVSDAIITADTDFHITSWNKRAEEMYGWTSEEALAKEIGEVIDLEFPGKSRQAVRREIKEAGAWRGRAVHYNRNGDQMMVDSSISLLTNARGDEIGSVAINRDVTQQASTEDALRHSEALFRSVVSNLGEGVLLTDETGTALYANGRFADITGYMSSELIGRTVYKLLFDEDRWPVYEKRLRDRMAGSAEIYQTKIRRKTEERVWVEINTVPYYDQDGVIAGTLELVTDISTRKALEETLLERDRILAKTAEASGALITRSNLEQAIHEALRILGEGLKVDRVYVFQNHENAETGVTLSTQLFEWSREGIQPQIDNPLLQAFPIGALPRWENRMREGKAVYTITRTAPALEKVVLEPQDIQSALVVPIMMDQRFWGFVGFDDCTRERSWSETEQVLLATVAGNLGGAIKRMTAEQEIIHARKRAEQANERSSRLLANVSHEFRSPLAVVLGYADLLRAIVEAGDDLPRDTVLESLTAIRRSGKRLQALVHNLLDISSAEEGTLHLIQKEIEINALVQNVIDEFSPLARDKGLQIKTDLWTGPINIDGDPVRVEEIVTNLVENAIKFTREGYVSISTHLEKRGAHCAVLVEVEDTGVGMSEEYLTQLFKPFTQESEGTTRAFEGAGIGLALSQRLAKLMGGHIRAQSTKNRGSRFIVSLPCANQNAAYRPASGMVQSRESGERHETSLPELLLVGPRRPVYRLWEHLLHQECSFKYIPDAEDVLEIVRQETTSIILVDVSAETEYGRLHSLAQHLGRDSDSGKKTLLIGALAEDAVPSKSDAALFDDTISHGADLDTFYEKFLDWLPQGFRTNSR